MIRRVFWLSMGAAAGITGYRRATAMGRALSGRVTGGRPAAAPGPPPARPPAPGLLSPRPRPHPQWSTARVAWRTSRAAWRAQKAAIAQVRAAGRFARDVREGMDLYMNQQEDPPGPNLASAASAARATGTPGTNGTIGRPRGRNDHVKDGR